MSHIPGRQDDRWYEQKSIVEALSVVPPLIAAGVGAAISLRDPLRGRLGYWLAAAAAWLLLSSIGKVLHARAQVRELVLKACAGFASYTLDAY